jgi:hypothetical protein
MFFRRRKKQEDGATNAQTPQKPKQTRKRQPKKSSPHKLYFNSETQEAIVAYQVSESKKERDALYNTKILPAFEKLVENLINIHKFTGLHDTYDDLKNDCVNFLFETIKKFDNTRGTNAFSYFNVVAKNWLIIRTKQKALAAKRCVSMDDIESMTVADVQNIEDYDTIQSQDVKLDCELSTNNTLLMLNDIRSIVKTPQELMCINSIITIFENIEELDLLNKTAVLLYMRELSGLTPKQLTSTMQGIRKHYRRLKLENMFDDDDDV